MYGKLFESMYGGTLYGNWEAIITLQQFVIIADESGLVDMTPPAIAAKTSIPLEIIEKGIQVLEQEDKYSRSGKEEGKRIILVDDSRPWGWQIVNYKYYRDLASREEKKIADRERIAEKRNKNKDVADCRNVSQVIADVAYTDTDTDTDTNKDTLNIDAKLWKEWLSVRRKKKAVNSETALKTLKNKLKTIVESGRFTANEAIETAIINSWKSIDLEWLDNLKPKQQEKAQSPFQLASDLANEKNLDPFKGAPYETVDQFVERINAC